MRQKKTSKAWIAAILGACMAVAAGAQESGWSVNTAPGGQEQKLELGGGRVDLTLERAVTLALEHNVSLEVNRYTLAQTGQGLLQATGIFDPVTQVTLNQQNSTSPATNTLVGASVNTQNNRTFNASVEKFLDTGTTLTLGWTNSRNKTNSNFYFLNPNYSSGLSLQFSQSLLQGFGTDVNRANIEIARRNREISAYDFQQTVITTIQNVENAYWNLVYALDNLKVQQQSLSLANDLLQQTQTRVRIGTSAPIDIVQSEATVAQREQQIIVAENTVEAAADILKQSMGFKDAEDWKVSLVPVDSLEYSPVDVDLDSAITKALADRLELKQQQLNEEIAKYNLLVAKNSTLPTLNLVGSYGYTGVAGPAATGELPAGSNVDLLGNWDTALQQILNRDYNRWSVGLNFSYPLGNHSAKAALAQRRFALLQARQIMVAQQQQVIAQVRSAVRDVQASVKTVAASAKARELAERNLDAEQKKFANGMSTNYQVLQIQEALAAAQATELQSRVGYRESLVAYEVAVGTLLDRMGVKLDDPGVPQPGGGFLSGTGWLRYGSWTELQPEKALSQAPSVEKKEPAEEK